MTIEQNNKHLNLVRVGALYLAGAWLIVQTVMSLTPMLGWPPIFGFGILFMFVPGFPIVLMMAWAFDATHQDKGWDKDFDKHQEATELGKGFKIAISILAGLAFAVMLLDIFVLVDFEPASEPVQQDALPANVDH